MTDGGQGRREVWQVELGPGIAPCSTSDEWPTDGATVLLEACIDPSSSPPSSGAVVSSRLVECCFTSIQTVGLLGTGAQDGHLDFHTQLLSSVLYVWPAAAIYLPPVGAQNAVPNKPYGFCGR